MHCPELFKNDHLLDLASDQSEYRRKSIENLNWVCSITRELRDYFNQHEDPLIVVNAGGFSSVQKIPAEQKYKKYDLIADALCQVDDSNVELIIQTMPPYPWHFGGQSNHNLFVDASEISKFCSENDVRICLDVSHTEMACAEYNWQLSDFVNEVGKYVAHIHLADAIGSDGEGVEFGAGCVNFSGIICPVGHPMP